jgi:hypothetical protein
MLFNTTFVILVLLVLGPYLQASIQPRILLTPFKLFFFALINYSFRSRDRSVGIATGYALNGWDSIPGKDKTFSLLHSVQTGSGAHPAPSPVGTGSSFPGGKMARA